MRKYTLYILFFLLSAFTTQAQLIVEFEGSDVDPGATVEVDVKVSDFDNLFGVQFSINWDSTVLKYSSVTNVNTSLPGFDVGAIGVPPGSVIVDEGEMTVSWFSSNAESLPDNTVLFTMVLQAETTPCDSTIVVVSDTPTAIEVLDQNFANIGINFTPTTVQINGTDCGGGGGGEDLTFFVNNRNVMPNTEICIPILTNNFDGYNGGMGKLSWDPNVLMYVRRQNNIGGAFNENATNVGIGEYNFLWENLDPANPVVLPDGSTLFELCFNVVGNVGDMTTIDLLAFQPDWGFTDAANVEVAPVLINGKITITDVVLDPVILTIGNISADEGSVGCMSVTVDNFTDILSMQGTFTWNNSVTTFNEVNDFSLQGLDVSDFNLINDSNLRVTWTAPSGFPDGVTLANGTELFKLCLNAIGDCMDTPSTQVDFVDVPSLNVEFTQFVGGNPTTAEDEINAGTFSVNPCGVDPVTCDVTSSTNVSCNGGSNGSIIVNVMNATDCDCIWYKDGSTTPFSTLSAPNCNLINVGAGSYRLEIVCNGQVECESNAVITQPGAIVINGNVTNIGCDNTTGSISTMVEGGSPGYTYLWNDPASSTTPNISNLPVGDYTVTVTDANDCTRSRTFSITEMNDPLTFTETVTGVTCFGDSDGEVVLNISGGCPDGSGNYNVTPSVLTGLAAGSVTVSVSDNSTPPMVITRTITIPGPASALEITGTPLGSTGNDGSISVMIDGGTPGYTITWTGGIPDGELNPTGLAPNSYTATVTDANGCMTSETFIVVLIDQNAPAVGSLTIMDASCNGEADGAVNGSVSSGVAPFTVEVFEGSTLLTSTTIASTGNFTLTGLSAGVYDLVVTGNNSESTTASITVAEPDAINLDIDVNCANGSNNDGSILLTATGGNGDFMYEWSTGAMTQNLENIPLGRYSVLVEDANGCQAIANNIRVNDCNPTNCYEAIPIITPNGDGINDFFVINCVMQETSNLIIFDRFGREVYQQSNYDNSWSGTDQNGDQLRESAFMWVLEVEFSDRRKEVFKGTVTVLTEDN